MYWGIDMEVSLSKRTRDGIPGGDNWGIEGFRSILDSSTPRLYRRSCWKVIHLERWRLRYWYIGVCLYWSVFLLTCWSVFCIRVAKDAQKREGPSAKFFSRHICYLVAILRFVTIYAPFGRLWAKSVFFLGQKQCFLGNRCTFTWYILQITLN